MSRQSLAARTGDRIAVSLAYGVIGLGLAFLAIPLVITCIMAFDARTYLGPMPPPALSLHWFERLVSQADILTSLRTSLILAVLTTVLSVTIGTAAAVGLARGNFPGKAALTSAFLSPLIVPPVVIGFGLLLFLSKAGITNGMARLLLGHVIVTLPYCIRTSLASLLGSDQRLTEAAMVLGATERQAFWTITLPLMRTGVVTGAIFAFAISIDDVSISLFLSDPSATTLPVTLVSNMRAAFDLTIAAAAVVLIAVTALLIVVLDRVVGFDTVVGQGLFRS
ncbi:ABC transporter permease [Rhizobium anhuiense]|uniref:ABC transporter permease n=1 Tax=Rhizobium anhuiense TaxID=1184720 RepID=A0A3S0Q4Z2_9HYPH|nr:MULTISPECIES: ABC transporter permease [Rhizobium]KZS55545.1 ABC transporter permease [Rhizobium anhuiense bv. trifolii]MBB3301438.1 putative spermidine/putrescine transport system permease protein [Rhizobium sp. BK112]MBB3370560.1 putative spermidine/putrescine transport system permease protein [Rhizobium sp. BK077]MBB3745112.1 putative spermidine/putrescine transport system permease protein [Rhizobium sp. BK591]MBB4114832.1 putative spermidine/putrescine transport system permease protein 